MKKVRRLRPDGSESDSCPMFDGVQVNDFHVSFFKHQVVNAANVETYPVNFVGVKGLNKGTEL